MVFATPGLVDPMSHDEQALRIVFDEAYRQGTKAALTRGSKGARRGL